MIIHSRSRPAITVLAFAALTLIVLSFTPTRAAGPWYVAPGGSDGSSCFSPAAACATINGAIGKATAGDTIKVATGIYTSTTGSEVVLLDRSATLSGGWDAAFTTQSGISTIDGGGAWRGITEDVGVTAVIERFIIQNGSAGGGGGIRTFGTLTLNNSIVNGNTGPVGDGGGIYNNIGTLTLINSTVSGNSSPWGGGGGIYNNVGTVILNNSTVSGNTASSSHPAVGGGGGIYNSNGTVALNNSTISGNLSPYSGGGIFNDGTLTLNNSTVSSNTGNGGGSGLRNFNGPVTLQNSILAGNTASVAGSDCIGTLSSAGYNLIGNTAGCTVNSTTGDLLNINPRLFPLIGSPGYHPLLPWSPAINAGNPAGCTDNLGNPLTTDQRGIARVGRCDIGAYEYDPNNDPLRYVFLSLLSR